MRRGFVSILPTLLSLTAAADASTPQLSAIRPVGAQRGTEVEVTLSGARLGDAQEILWYQPGIETLAINRVDDNNVKTKLKIAPDCPLGLHDLRLRTATGLSELRTFSVGALPETSEVEPNNDFAAPQAIPLGVVVNGVAENEDVDYFIVEAKQGQRITAEVEGLRLGITHFDPAVAILDTKRFELSSSDDAALLRVDGVASIVAPEEGKYIIQVRESAYAGNGACLYRLHVGTFPRPSAIVPAGGKAGESVEVRWIGDVLGARTRTHALPAQPDPNHGLFAEDDGGIAPYPNPFRVSPFGNVIEAEPNNDAEHATPFTPPIALNGVIDKPGDADHFVFQATKGQTFDLKVRARRLRSPLDSVLHIARKGGAYIAGADDSAGPDSVLRFTAPEDGEFDVYLHDQLLKGGPTYFYRIEVTPVEPKLTISLQSEQSAIGIPNVTAAVPRGNRVALLVNASRADWGGDLNVSAEALPPGVVIASDAMPASQSVVPVLFTAGADAPVGGMLTRLLGTPTDPNIKLAGQSFNHNSVLVFGANNVDFWSRTVDRMAVAVVEECPYTIEVVEPKVPLVNSGTMNLKVVARRKGDFKGPIALNIPWLPPGVGASGGVSIPEGQDEALIPMNAGGAEARAWKLVVHGDANIPTGPVRVSSQLFTLRIDQPYVQLAYNNTTVEQGKATDLAVKVTKVKDFDGEAAVTLIGLPNKAETEVKRITKDTTDLTFPIKTAPDTPAGNHANLFCLVVITENGEPITHNLGTGALRVDVPIPPKADAPPAPAAEAPQPAPEAPSKPLTRLEKLRQEAAERAKAGGK
jgi:hypothetical protein